MLVTCYLTRSTAKPEQRDAAIAQVARELGLLKDSEVVTGTGDAAKETNDLLVTTQSVAKVGDVVTASGVVRTNKDFGSGYTYKVLVEDATLKP